MFNEELSLLTVLLPLDTDATYKEYTTLTSDLSDKSLTTAVPVH